MKKKLLVGIMVAVCAIGLVACGKSKSKEEKNVNIEDIHAAVKEAYGDQYYPNMEYDAVTLEEKFGIKEDMYVKTIAEAPKMSFSVDTFIAIEAKSDKADEVEKLINDYRKGLIEDARQYPTNQLKIEASQVVRHGNYVFFVLLGEIPMDVEEKGDDAILEEAKAQTQKGVDVIDNFFK